MHIRSSLFLAAFFLLGGISDSLHAKAKNPPATKSVKRYSLTRGEPLTVEAREARLPLIVYGDKALDSLPFIASGYMGDTTSLKVNSGFNIDPIGEGAGKTALRVIYSAKGREGWAGVYWLSPANNWGRVKGAGYDLRRAEKLTFWIRGEKGGEVIQEIKMGGIAAGPYPDSGEASLGPIRLKKRWEQYSIDIKNIDLQHIIGGFAFIVRRVDNRKGATFYLDEIQFEKDVNPLLDLAGVEPETLEKDSSGKRSPYEDQLFQPIRKMIPFDTANEAFSEETEYVLENVLDVAMSNESATVIVEGHTDDLGPADINMKLSRERASAVADYLAARGLRRARIIVIGYGEERPLSPQSNQTEDGRKRNRRVELILIPR